MCIEADYRQHKFFLRFFSRKVPCDKMSLAPIQKLIPDSIRSRKMIEGVFPTFSPNASSDVSKSAKTQKAKFRAGGAEIAGRGPPATSSRRVLSHHGSTQTLSDTWTASVKGRDTEEWAGETVFVIEGCAHVPAQCMYVYRDTNGWCICYFQARRATVCESIWIETGVVSR